MASCIFLTIFLLFNIGLCRGQPTWDQEKVSVDQDPDLDHSMACTINIGSDPFAVVRIFRLEEENGEMEEKVITENDGVKEPYMSTGRYLIDYRSDPVTKEAVATLTIQGVRGEDAGRYGCVSIMDYDNIAYLEMEVHVPISEIYMIKISDATEIQSADGATVHLSEGTAMGVGCVVKVDGGLVPPSVILTVDGEDRTDLFTPLIDSQKIKETDTGPEKYYTEVRYTYVTVLPSSDLNQKNLTCVATSDYFPSRQASVFLDIKYKPVITCPQYEIYVPKGESATIKCVLRSNPGATVTWSYGDDRNEAKVVDTAEPEGKMSVKESPFSEDQTNIDLVIAKVSSKHFTQYYLTASNDIGITDVTITLKKGDIVTEPPVHQVNPPSNTVDNDTEDPKADHVHSNAACAVAVTPLSIVASWCTIVTLWSLRP